MLKEEYVEIYIYKNSKNKNYYKNKGYKIIDNSMLLLKISDLKKSSTIKVKTICDICGKEKLTEYRYYLKNIKKYNYYSCHGKCSRKKFKCTNVEKYNVENPSQLKESKEKLKNTCLKKYGCENVFQNEKIKEKIKNTCLKKYGVENPNQNLEIRKKNKNTCLKKYGVEHPMQNEKIFEKNEKMCFSVKKHDKTKLFYRSSYEEHFLNFCIKNNINIKKGKRIKYYIKNTPHYYFSDFFIDNKNLIIEIKSSWTYNKDKLKNITKKEYTLKSGYNFLFIIDKNYNELLEKIK